MCRQCEITTLYGTTDTARRVGLRINEGHISHDEQRALNREISQTYERCGEQLGQFEECRLDIEALAK